MKPFKLLRLKPLHGQSLATVITKTQKIVSVSQWDRYFKILSYMTSQSNKIKKPLISKQLS